ncbi:hypothetical protein D3C75_1141070 [compost metagenome]
MYTAACAGLRFPVQNYRFGPIQTSAFTNEFLLYRKETGWLPAAFCGPEHPI